uniref:M20/M25/M40 family metallo-hydrolase n=1 Tax=Turicimonas muris TaxID=1796652 RepID=UPI00263B8BAB
MPSEFQKKSSEFAKKCFDDIREMSKDGQGVSRQGYSPVETQVLEYFKKIGNELNLEISTDKAGNVWMTIPGKNRNLPALVSGSHVDSVPQGGNYDGLAGVVAALTVARWMREINYVPERDYTVLMMRMEESSWFGKCYVGSLGMTGQLTEQDLALKHRSTGKTLKETIKACGFNPDDLTTGVPVVDLAKMAAFIELHIEQGPTLDSSDTRVGIVVLLPVLFMGWAAQPGGFD